MPLPRSLRNVIRILGVILGVLLVIYLALLGSEAYSAWQLSRILTCVEALRLGDTAPRFQQAISGCPELQRNKDRWTCIIDAAPSRVRGSRKWSPRLWDTLYLSILPHSGLRWWHAVIDADVPNGAITAIHFHIFIQSRYEMLGTAWTIRPEIPRFFAHESVGTATHMGGFAITAVPGGEGFGFDFTPASSAEELTARQINRACLVSFRGCDGLCEFLPKAAALLKKEGRGFGIWTDVPRSACDLR